MIFSEEVNDPKGWIRESKGENEKNVLPFTDFQEKEYGVFEERSFRYGIHRSGRCPVVRQSPAACILLPDTVRIAFSVQVFLLEKVHFPVFHKAFEYCPSDESALEYLFL